MKKIFTSLLILVIFLSCLSFVSCKKDDPTATTFTVTFATKGGSAVSSQEVKEGENATRPQDPTKDGYDFIGWYLNDVLYDFNSPVVADITLVAKWQQKTGSGSGSVDFPWVDVPIE